MSGSNKITIERNQKTILELVAKPGNDICADCKARNPRWASHNLGIFICVNCASIHRKMGTHISKVKSITFDSWTKEQVEVMKNNGNLKSNAYFNSNEIRNPPPPSMMEHERDSELEQYIRSKYQYKRFIDKSALVASKLGPSRSASSVSPSPSPSPRPQPAATPAARPSTVVIPSTMAQTQLSQSRSVSQPLASQSQMAQTRSVSQPLMPRSQPQQQIPQVQLSGQVWEDLVSLQAPSSTASLPLQFQSTAPTQPFNIPNPNQGLQPNMYGNGNLSASPGYGMGMTQTATGIGMNPSGMGLGMGTNPFHQQQQQFSTGIPPMLTQQQQQSFGQPYPASSMSGAGFGASTFGQQYFANGPPAPPPIPQPAPQQYFQPQPLAPQQQVSQQQMFMTGTPQLQQQPGQQFMSHTPQAQGQQHFMAQSHSPFGVSQSHSPFGGSPSPFGQQQGGQVQGEQMLPQGGGYQGQQWGQGGYVGQGQQQWGGM